MKDPIKPNILIAFENGEYFDYLDEAFEDINTYHVTDKEQLRIIIYKYVYR